MGIGTYLGGIDDETDEQVVAAILRSIATNWNVIDTGKICERAQFKFFLTWQRDYHKFPKV